MKDNLPVVLAIDDEHTIRDLIKYTLEPENMIVVTADNGRAGLRVLETEPVDVIITDLLMPLMTGLEFLREIKKRKTAIPVIIITAYGNIEMAKQILSEGVFKLLEKPLDFDVLVPIVKDALKQKKR
ncbi:MAG: response regulator [Spirochaetes bacterium]|nr:response regulator [Spirochaetota bacterium]